MKGMYSGSMTITGKFCGMLNGIGTVPAGESAKIKGMINGTLIVEPGASVRVTGMVNGTIVDRGGAISVTGMVDEIVRE